MTRRAPRLTLAAMSKHTSPRWPALRGLRIFLARDAGLVLAALFAPFTAALYHLRRIGLEGTGTEPDPTSLPERFVARFCHKDDSVITIVAVVSSILWLVAAFMAVVTAVLPACGGAS